MAIILALNKKDTVLVAYALETAKTPDQESTRRIAAYIRTVIRAADNADN